MTAPEMARRLADLGGDIDLLFADELWNERADAGVDDDGPDNPQALVGEASEVLHRAVRALKGLR